MFSSPKPKYKIVDYDQNKHSPKNTVEKLNDLFFVLFVLAKGEEKNIPITIGTLIKTLFISKTELAKDIKFYHTGFYPYKHGPYNSEFNKYVEELSQRGLLKKDGYNLSLTIKGSSLTQPLLEAMKKADGECQVIEDSVEKNLPECVNFFRKSDELHKEKLIDETNDGKIIDMQTAIDSFPQYCDKYIESINEGGKQFVLPSGVINELLNIEAEIENSDYNEVGVLENASQLLEIPR
jgi:uncharacterized protein YwgA